jgi:hypothetical protein
MIGIGTKVGCGDTADGHEDIILKNIFSTAPFPIGEGTRQPLHSEQDVQECDATMLNKYVLMTT